MGVIDKFRRGFGDEDDGERGILFRKPDSTVWVRQADGTESLVGSGGGGGPWGKASDAAFMGSGSPVGAVTPDGVGDFYVDNTTPGLWQATGVTSDDWQPIPAVGGTNDVSFRIAGVQVQQITNDSGDVVVANEMFYGDPLSISNGAFSFLPFSHKIRGADLVDLTTPTAPTVLAAGVYALTAEVQATTQMAPGGYFQANVAMDNGPGGQNAQNASDAQAGFGDRRLPTVTVTGVLYLPAGATIGVGAVNLSG